MYFSLFRGLKRYKKTHNRVKGIYRDYGFSNWQALLPEPGTEARKHWNSDQE